MQSNFNLISAIKRGIWAIEPNALVELLPTAESILSGSGLAWLNSEPANRAKQATKFGQLAEAGRDGFLAAVAGPSTTFRMNSYTDLDQLPANSIAIVPLQGVVMKSGYCGGGGSMGRADMILEAASHPNVVGILIDCDTGGGQANGLNTLHDAILRARTEFLVPVLLLVNDGMCASAGYHTASACSEIWATHATCTVGSIGAVTQLTDASKRDEKEGITRRLIYATKSTRKHGAQRDALAGDDSGIIKELDLLNDDFHARILAQRGDKLNETGKHTVLDGEMYGAEEALTLGLIDHIGSYDEALAHLLELAGVTSARLEELPADPGYFPPADTPNFSTQTPNTSMKYAAICALLGYSALEATAEGAHLNAEALTALENALVERTNQATQLVAVNGQLATANTNLATQATALSTAQGEIKTLEEKVLNNPAADAPKLEGQEQDPKGSKELSEWEKADAAMLDQLHKDRKLMGLD
jgi:ClpP class serine protease